MITSTSSLTLQETRDQLFFHKNVHKLLAQCEDCVLFTSVEEAVAKYFYLDYFHLYIARLEEKAVGLIGVELVEPGAALIHHLCVDLKYRWRGIGSNMIRSLVDEMGLDYLEARTTELDAGFYKANGFKTHSIRSFRRQLDEYGCVWTRGSITKE